MRSWIKRSIILIMLFPILYFSFQLYTYHLDIENQKSSYEQFDEENWDNPLLEAGIIEKDNIYFENEELQVDELYVTITEELKNEEDEKINFHDIINTTTNNNLDFKVDIFFENSNNKVLDNGIFMKEPNATLEIKESSKNEIQKSFKIRLFDKEGLWHNQNIINLNKHYDDTLRIRNKLSFDYFKIIPNITSFKTRFVRFFVKDINEDEFSDYGFFTHIEQPNKLFLTNHGLDTNGYLYKAENFRFLRYASNIRTKDDKDYNEKLFEDILEIKGNDKHQKLIDMLEAVNDLNTDIDDIVDIYFDKENYLTWLGINILFDNYDTSNANYLLYSPINSSKWYFMPWDYDKAWGLEEERAYWQRGLSAHWNNFLNKRFLKKEENRKALDDKINELRKKINKEQTKKFLDSYYEILFSNITKLPDFKYLQVTFENFKSEYEQLPSITELNYNYYNELLQNPMPVYLRDPVIHDNKIMFSWEKSFDFQNEDLVYEFELSKDKDFSSVIISNKEMKDNMYEIESLEKGIYYWRVIVMDSKGNYQTAINEYRDEFNDKYFGIKKLVIE